MGAALACCTSGSVAGSDERPVVAQDLKSPLVSGKVAAVLWTVRRDRCTLQVLLPPPRAMRIVQGKPLPPAPKIQVWLSRADGSVIRPDSRWESSNFDAPGPRKPGAPAPEVNFIFPLSAGSEAAAASVEIDGQVFSDRIN